MASRSVVVRRPSEEASPLRRLIGAIADEVDAVAREVESMYDGLFVGTSDERVGRIARRLARDRARSIERAARSAARAAREDAMHVELLAVVADALARYQETIADEAYLDTARGRATLRRRARELRRDAGLLRAAPRRRRPRPED